MHVVRFWLSLDPTSCLFAFLLTMIFKVHHREGAPRLFATTPITIWGMGFRGARANLRRTVRWGSVERKTSEVGRILESRSVLPKTKTSAALRGCRIQAILFHYKANNCNILRMERDQLRSYSRFTNHVANDMFIQWCLIICISCGRGVL